MNVRQKWALKLTAAGTLITFLFPPFRLVIQGSITSYGYSFLALAPKASNGFSTIVDVPMLSIQLFVVLIIGGIAYILQQDKKI